MFFHTYKYALKSIIRTRSLILWTFLFPIFLGTVFYFTLGQVFENSDVFTQIPIAVVEEVNSDSYFLETMKRLDTQVGLLDVNYTSKEEAENLLKEGEIVGFYITGEENSLVVKEEGTRETILTSVLDQYIQVRHVITDLAMNNPSKIPEVLEAFADSVQVYKVVNEDGGNMNVYLQYFYALIGMSCLYAMFLGVDRCIKLQADLSPLGQRRCIAPTHKMQNVLSEFFACLTIQFAVECILLFYLIVILKMDFGTQIPAILLNVFLGSAFGVAMGIFIGALPKLSDGIKIGIGISVSMIFSFLSGLMFDSIRSMVEHNCPILNRINPCALMVDSFYALNLFEGYSRYAKNMGILAFITAILCCGAFLLMRRNTYASL